MSGSSLDGLDIAYCQIEGENDSWTYKVLKTETIEYPIRWKLRLSKLVLQNAINYLKTHVFYGHYVSTLVNDFIATHNIREEIDLIASHGQTIFHQPENNLTSQIGDGAAIAAETGLPVVCDFRTIDVALGGQGTPIVPIGEKHLFGDYRFFLNIGGIANLSARIDDSKFVAFDTCAANLILNLLAGEISLSFDENGDQARKGNLSEDLLHELNGSWYYDKDYPKSLSGGWVSKVFAPAIRRFQIPVQDKLRTVVEHMAIQISSDIEKIKELEGLSDISKERMLVTGGGALNTFLMERLKEHCPIEIAIPEEQIINYKEAIIIAFMGVLRVQNQINVLSSVTGSSRDNIGGTIYQGSSKVI